MSVVWTAFLFAVAILGVVASGTEEPKTKRFKAGAIQLEIPDTWRQAKTKSRFHLAQFEITNPTTEAENAEFAVFRFVGPAGHVMANMQRWIGQFAETGREVQMVQGKCGLGTYVLADIAGTWRKPVGSPRLGKTIDQPNSRMIGIILSVHSPNADDFYLLQLSGPDALVKETVPALRASMGAQPDLEKPYELKGGTIVRSEQEWKKLLTREEYRVLRQKGTEQPFVNKYDKHFEPGTYSCAGCGQELFSSETKFNSGCGWPAFYAAKAEDRVILSPDHSGGRIRTEVTCARCGSHLGHIFNDAPQTPTGNRYCINSVALKFTPAQNEKKEVVPEEDKRD